MSKTVSETVDLTHESRPGFAPGPGLERALRDALGQFATGVVIVTTGSERGMIGITANSFASVSLNPPLVLWSPARSSRRFQLFAAAERFSIHILPSEAAAIARHFTHEALPPPTGLGAVLARFDCRRHAVHDGGDHAIVVGQVEWVWSEPGRPLVFHAGRYGSFVPF